MRDRNRLKRKTDPLYVTPVAEKDQAVGKELGRLGSTKGAQPHPHDNDDVHE